MRRVLGITLTGLGAFFLVLAVMCRFYLPGQVIKFPLNEYSVSSLSGTNVAYFSPQTGKEVNGATVRAISTVQGDVAGGSSSTAVWNDVTGVFDVTSSPQVPISYSTQRFAFDRRTGVLVNCCGAEVGTKRPHFAGQGYVWPLGTQKKTYEVFNTSVMKPEPFDYTGTTTVNGLTVYTFVQHLNNLEIGKVPFPGSLLGIKNQPTVTAPVYLSATSTFYVEPGTGSPIKVIETQDETLQNPVTGATALVLLKGTLTSTPQSVAAAVNTASSSDTEISLVQVILPLVGLLLGLLLVVFGVILLLGESREYYDEYEDDEAVGAQA
ncbi:MAG: DUF3068 domain-containing protein [Streptosporangiaceae bacterium]